MNVFIVSNNAFDPDAGNLIKMARFFGCESLNRPGPAWGYSIIVRREHLRLLADVPPAQSVLVYGPDRKDGEKAFSPCPGSVYRIGPQREITRQLAGLSISAKNPGVLNVLPKSEEAQTIISLNHQPFLTLLGKDGCDWFSLAQNEIIDLDDPVDAKFNLDAVFGKLMPFAMFFKYIQHAGCFPSANLIIDDPTLQRSYGFIDYDRMAQVVNDYDFSVTIAFIPWNYRKSSTKTIGLFNKNRERMSICVHGCDHTAGEFAETKETVLDWKVCLARNRMEKHKRIFGLSYDNTIVFPHGAFSEQSMRVLSRYRFAGAVNSTLFARDYSGGLKVRDAIAPAINHYGLPLFLRRYPNRLEDFACDLFFGRPVLIVQHTRDFADGWEKITDFIGRLRSIEPALNWMRLGKIVERYCPESDHQSGEPDLSPHYRGELGYTFNCWFKTAVRRNLCQLRDRVIFKNKYLGSLVTKKSSNR